MKKCILGSGHNSLGGPMMLEYQPLPGLAHDRRVLSKICPSSLRRRKSTYWQHHDAVPYFSDRSHVGDPSVNTPAETESVCRRSWFCCPCDAASFAEAGTAVAEQEASEGQGRWGTTAPDSLLTVPSDVVVGADDDDLFIDQLDQPSDVQRGVEQELL